MGLNPPIPARCSALGWNNWPNQNHFRPKFSIPHVSNTSPKSSRKKSCPPAHIYKLELREDETLVPHSCLFLKPWTSFPSNITNHSFPSNITQKHHPRTQKSQIVHFLPFSITTFKQKSKINHVYQYYRPSFLFCYINPNINPLSKISGWFCIL